MNKEAKIALEKMNLLMERMEKHYTKTQVDLINEELDEALKPAKNRRQISQDEFTDVAENMRGGVKSTMCYISVRELFLPFDKEGKPTFEPVNRKFNVNGKIKGVVKFGRYTFNWRSRENMDKRYQEGFVDPFNRIRRRYGLPDVDQEKKPKNGMLGGAMGQDLLKREVTFFIQDAGGKDCQAVFQYFLIGNNGEVLAGPISEDDMREFFKFQKVPGEDMLRDLGADEGTIKEYADEYAALNFAYKRFNVSNLVSVVTTYKGEKIMFFNETIPDKIANLKINPEFFVEYAKKMYGVDNQ